MGQGMSVSQAEGPKAAQMQPGDEFEFERTFGWLMHDANRLLLRVWERRLKGAGVALSLTQVRVLASLIRKDGRTQTELALAVGLERAPLGRIIDKMEGAGWLTRQADPQDRRVWRVYLTKRIDEIRPVLAACARDMFQQAFKGVAPQDADQRLTVLSKLKANLSTEEDENSL